jgi:hypothetical protein
VSLEILKAVSLKTAALNKQTVAQQFETQRTFYVAQHQVTHLHKVKIHILPALTNHIPKN